MDPHTRWQANFVLSCHKNFMTNSSKIEDVRNKYSGIDQIDLVCGSQIVQTISYEDWVKKCDEYIFKYFRWDSRSMRGRFVQFPPPYVLNNNISKLGMWFANRCISSYDGSGAVITNYDIAGHIKFMGYDINSVLSDLYLMNIGNFENRLLILCPNRKVILNVRYTTAIDILNVQKELEVGQNDIMLLLFLHYDALSKSGVCIINVVAAPNLLKEEEDFLCKHCFVMHKDNLVDEEQFQEWWSNMELFLQTTELELGSSATSHETDKIIVDTVSSIFGFMSTRKLPVSVMSFDTHKQIKSLMLTTKQQRILYSDYRKKIVKGCFGSGKTFIGIYQMQLLTQQAVEETVIYYICFDDVSLLPEIIQGFVNSCMDLHGTPVSIVVTSLYELAAQYGLDKLPSLSELFYLLLLKNKGKQLHVILDELDGEKLDLTQAKALRALFATERDFDQSYVLFLIHSMEKHRELCSLSLKEPHKTNRYKETGMKIFDLFTCMRMPLSTFKVGRSCQNILSNSVKVMNHPINSSCITDGTVENEHFVEVAPVRNHAPELLIRENFEDDNNFSLSTSPLNESQPSAIRRSHDVDSISMIFDPALYSKDIRTETRFKYAICHDLGHQIKGVKPILLSFEEKAPDNINCIVMLAIALENICFKVKTKCSRLIICQSTDQYRIFIKVLKVLKKDFIFHDNLTQFKLTHSNGQILLNLPVNDSYILLTNYRGSRGLEAEEVVILIDPTQENEEQYLYEKISRCTSRLVLITMERLQCFRDSDSLVCQVVQSLMKNSEVDLLCIHPGQKFSTEMPYEELQTDECKTGMINTASLRYMEMCEEVEEMSDILFNAERSLDIDQNIFILFEKPNNVLNLKCEYHSPSACILSWNANAFPCIIKKQAVGVSDTFFEEVTKSTSACEYEVNDLSHDMEYRFSVTAVNSLGESTPTVVNYKHSDKDEESVRQPQMEFDWTFEDMKKLIKNNEVEAMKQILHGNNNVVKMRDPYNLTLLHIAVWSNKPAIVQLLLDNDADTEAKNDYGITPTHWAAGKENCECLKRILLSSSKSINLTNTYNQTPLWHAAVAGRVDNVRLLLDYEADIDVKNCRDLTALDVSRNDTIKKILMTYKEYKHT